MRKVLISLLLLQIVKCGCPEGYTLYRKGQCRGIGAIGLQAVWSESYKNNLQICAKAQAIPMVILDEEDNDYYAKLERAGGPKLMLGLTCNDSSKEWMWADGSAVLYHPQTVGAGNYLMKACQDGCSFDVHVSGNWGDGCETSVYNTDYYCVFNLPPIDPYFSECDDEFCYEISKSSSNFTQAEHVCQEVGGTLASIHTAQQNSFIRRLAVAKGFLNGVLLGAGVTGKSKNFEWLDGTDWDYEHFEPGFPIPSLGSCLGMVTDDTIGGWVNIDCASHLPAVCTQKKAYMSQCPGAHVKEGDIITSPGFPNVANISCDFFLSVDQGKVIEIEIVLLEANSCCDNLVLHEGILGGNLIANITGEVSMKKYYTTSNMARISWEPTDGANVRGLMFKFQGVKR